MDIPACPMMAGHHPTGRSSGCAKSCYITPEYKQERIGRVIYEVEDMRSYATLLENFSTKGFRATIGSGEKIKAHAELFDDILGL